MQISKIGITKLADLICDDKIRYKYRSLKELKFLFYGNATNIDFEDTEINRKEFCINAIKNTREIGRLLKDICDVRNFDNTEKQIEFIDDLNNILNVDNIKVERKGLYINVFMLSQNFIAKNSLTTYPILSLEYVDENIEKAQEKILKGDYSGAITNSRTLLEQIIRDLCNKYNIEYSEVNPKRNFDSLRKEMNLNPKDYEENGFLEITTGLIKCVNGIFEVRNKCSDGHSRRYNPKEHHAKLCLNSALTISEFLVESYLYQKKRGK